MTDFLLLMHNDGGQSDPAGWDTYLTRLETAGILRGGSAIGRGTTYRKTGAPAPLTRRRSADLPAVKNSLTGASASGYTAPNANARQRGGNARAARLVLL